MRESEIVETLRSAGSVYAEDEARLLHDEAVDAAALAAMVQRRVDGEPLEYIVGWAEFCGLRIAVEPGVFVPRRRTEFLVEQAVALEPRIVLDLCCGSGAIAAAVLARVGAIEMHAADIDPVAVRCARRNVDCPVYEGDLFDPVPPELAGRIDLITLNAPYVPTDEVDLMPREARLYEARIALDGGADGTDLHRRVIADAHRWLAPGGHLLIETSRAQAPLGVAACARHGLTARVERSDVYGATVLSAARRAESPVRRIRSGHRRTVIPWQRRSER